MFIQFIHVDATTARPVNQAPAAGGPVFPALPGLQVTFANESAWPCELPLYWGECAGDADTTTPGVLAVLTHEQFEQAQAQEMAARLARAKADALKHCNAQCNEAIGQLVADYPEREVQSWPQQVSEATALQSDPETQATLLDMIAAQRGVPRQELAARVLQKATLFAAASGQLIGMRQRIEDLLDAAATVAEVFQVPTLPQLMAQEGQGTDATAPT